MDQECPGHGWWLLDSWSSQLRNRVWMAVSLVTNSNLFSCLFSIKDHFTVCKKGVCFTDKHNHFWQCLGTSVLSKTHLMVPYLCSSGSNAQGKVDGLWRALYQLKIPWRVWGQDEQVAARKKDNCILSDKGSLIFYKKQIGRIEL